MDKRGFTLIELLVVIAIIAILAAILFPLFLTVKEHGRQVHCLNNLRQFGVAFRSYADDWNGRLPVARVVPETPSGTYLNWCGALAVCGEIRIEKGQIFPYVKNKQMYLCPSDKGRRVPWGNKEVYPLSYAMNILLSWRVLETMQRPDIPNCGRNTRLGKILLLIHEDRSTINDGDFNWIGTDIPDHVHFDGTTILYCDLHAKWQHARAILKARDKGEYNPDYLSY